MKQLLVLMLETNAVTSEQNVLFPETLMCLLYYSVLAALAIVIITAFLVHPIKPPVRILNPYMFDYTQIFLFCRKQIYICQCTSDISSDSLGDPYPSILTVVI